MESSIPNYKRIYTDILDQKYPHKKEKCTKLLNKRNLSSINIIELNTIIFGIADQKTEHFNQRHRSYSKSDILKILDYQEEYRLNNCQLANHFKLSRNTVAKWKKMFVS